ncbi:phospholipase D-like domain-containing protein [Vibrio parahaemolyticus]|nr:phospholipase D-like domain-containing protein [Vibrio parahaemolyticus]MDF5321192.1 phospholipase D-like domain-containing protein [Vibrio parahaemolyticus]
MDNIQKHAKYFSKTVDQSNVRLPPVWSHNGVSKREAVAETQSDLFISGEKRELASYVIDLINNARESVVLSSFLLADTIIEDAIFDATERGVRVYLMLACETRLEGDVPDDDFGKECLLQHTKMLKRLGGRVVVRSASHFHSKVVLVDALPGNTPHVAKGVLLTANLTREAFERNEELAVCLSSEEVQETVKLLKWAMFEYAEHEMLDNSEFSATSTQNVIAFPNDLKRIVCTTDSQHSLKAHVLKLINESSQELMISSFGWQKDHEVIDAICEKAKQGVKVTILSRVRPSSMPSLIKLAEAGAEVFGFKWLHAKAIWNEHNHGMIMSANLQEHGLDTGFEIGVTLDGERAKLINQCLVGLLGNSTSDIRKLLLNSMLSSHVGEIQYWQDGRLQSLVISSTEIKEIPSLIAECLTDLELEPEFPVTNWKSSPSCLVEYKWQVLPPELPVNCKEVLWEEKQEISHENEEQVSTKANRKKKKPKMKVIKHSYEPKVYQVGNRKLIAVSESDDLAGAIRLKTESFPTASIVLKKAG